MARLPPQPDPGVPAEDQPALDLRHRQVVGLAGGRQVVLVRPQLIAVTDDVNQAKGDQDPATWLPSVTSCRCTYVRTWAQVKYYYGLAVGTAEKNALTSILNGC